MSSRNRMPSQVSITKEHMDTYLDRIQSVFPSFYTQFRAKRSTSQCNSNAYSKTINEKNKNYFIKEIQLFKHQLSAMADRYNKKCNQVQQLQNRLKSRNNQHQPQTIESLKKYHLIEKSKITTEYQIKIKQINRDNERLIDQQKLYYENIIEDINQKQQQLNRIITKLQNQIKELQSVICNSSHNLKFIEQTHISNYTINKMCKENSNIEKITNLYRAHCQVQNLKLQLSNLRDQNYMLRNHIQVHENQQKCLKEQLQKQIHILESQNNKLYIQLSSAKNRVSEVCKQGDQKTGKLSKQYTNKINQKQQQINALKNKIHQLKMQYDLKSSRIQSQMQLSTKKSRILQKSIQQKITILQHQQSINTPKSINRSQQQQKYRSIVKQKSQYIEQLHNQLSTFKNKQTKCYVQIQQLRKCRNDLSYQNNKLENTINLLREQIMIIQQKMKQNQKTYNEYLQKQANKHKKQYNVDELQQKLSQKVVQLRQAHQKYTIFRQQQQHLNRQHRAQIQNCTKQLRIIQQNVRDAQNNRKQVLQQYQRILSIKQQLQRKYGELQQEYKCKQAKYYENIIKYQQKICNLEIQNCDYKAQHEIYQVQKNSNLNNLKKLEQSQQKSIKLTIYIRELQQNLQQHQSKIQQLTNTLNQLIHQNNQLQSQLQNTSYKQQNNILLNKVTQLQSQIQLIQQHNTQQSQQLTTYQQMVTHKEQILKQLQQNYNNLLIKIQQYQNKLESITVKHRNQLQKYQIVQEQTSTKQKQRLKYYEIQINDLRQYIRQITQQKQELHIYIQNTNQFVYGKFQQISAYNTKFMESSQKFSFRKNKVQEFLAQKQVIVEQDNHIENVSQVFTVPDFSQKKLSPIKYQQQPINSAQNQEHNHQNNPMSDQPQSMQTKEQKKQQNRKNKKKKKR